MPIFCLGLTTNTKYTKLCIESESSEIPLPRGLLGKSHLTGGTTMSKIALAGLNKEDVLAALFNAAKPQGIGFMNYDPKPMTQEEAKGLLKQTTYFDYLKGRVMKVNLAGDELNTLCYDRANGQGAAERAIAELRTTGDANSSTIQAVHHTNTLEAAEDMMAHLN